MDILVRTPPRRMILLNADLSQVESRVELMLAAGTPEFYNTDIGRECVRLATAHPADFDIHTYSAATALGKSEADVTRKDTPDGQPSDRQIGKSSMHGFMRGMGAQTMADFLLKNGYVVPPEVCAQRLARLAAKLPAIPDGYFVDVERQCMRYRSLGSSYGGIWRCDFQRLEAPLYGKAYSYGPVRDTVDLINQHGFLPLQAAIRLRRLTPHPDRPTPRVHVHGHDSLAISVHPDDAYPVMSFLERTLAQATLVYRAGTLQVPVGYGLGPTWQPVEEFKRLPSREQVREVAWHCATMEGAR